MQVERPMESRPTGISEDVFGTDIAYGRVTKKQICTMNISARFLHNRSVTLMAL